MEKRLYTTLAGWAGLVLFVLTLWIAPVGFVYAQDSQQLVLFPPEPSTFPEIGFYTAAYDAEGNFITNLQPANFKVLEDGQTRPLTRMEWTEPGLQFITAINAGPVMATPVAGVTYFQQVKEALSTWAQGVKSIAPNDYSLVTNNGIPVSRSQDLKMWQSGLNAFEPDLMATQPGVSSLTQALDLAADPNTRPRMKRSILYITVPPNAVTLQALPALIERAVKQKVPVNVWLVATPDFANSSASEVLSRLATSTGGQFYFYDYKQPFPSPEGYLRGLRYMYHGAYASGITRTGDHHLEVQVQREGQPALSASQDFSLRVAAPNPIFLSPPARIVRSMAPTPAAKAVPSAAVTSVPTTTTTAPAGGGVVKANDSVDIKILVEFPDGFTRPLKYTRLYADGRLVAENTQPPFDVLKWPLIAYTTSGTHLLKVEAQDTLGLGRSTIDMPVEVTISTPVSQKINERLSSLLKNRDLLVWLSMVLAGIGLLVLAVFAGRRIWRSYTASASTRPTRVLKDPVTQPVRAYIEPKSQARRPSMIPTQPTWPRPQTSTPGTLAPARFVRLSNDGSVVPGGALPVTSSEMTFGSDPQQAMIVLDNPSVSPLHTRLSQSPEGSFILADAGSVAGTWVNYAPVSNQGVRLEHGDLVQIGRAAFRFELSKPGRVRQPVITPYTEDMP